MCYYCIYSNDNRFTLQLFWKIVRTIGQSAIDVECFMGKWIIKSGKILPNGMMSSSHYALKFWKANIATAGQTNGRCQHRTKERENKLNTRVFESTFNSRNENHACALRTSHCVTSVRGEESNCKFSAIVVTRRAWNDCVYINSVHCNWPWRDYVDTLMVPQHIQTHNLLNFHLTVEQRASHVHDFRF